MKNTTEKEVADEALQEAVFGVVVVIVQSKIEGFGFMVLKVVIHLKHGPIQAFISERGKIRQVYSFQALRSFLVRGVIVRLEKSSLDVDVRVYV